MNGIKKGIIKEDAIYESLISFKRAGTVPDGSALNAASVGANNVNGPVPESVPSNEQASTATFKVV